MGIFSFKNLKISLEEINSSINKINNITTTELFVNKTLMHISFSLLNSNKIKATIKDYDYKNSYLSENERIKYLNIDTFINYYNTLMSILNIFLDKKIGGKLETLSEEERMNYCKDENFICPICQEKKVNISLPCSHFFCESCINSWMLKSHNSCPICRQNIKRSKINDSNQETNIQGAKRWSVFTDENLEQANQMNKENIDTFFLLNKNLFNG